MNLNPRTEGREFPIILIHGPSGCGKTRAAATASAFHKLRPKEERTSLIELSDMLWLLLDRDGLQSLQTQGMEPNYYDFSHFIEDLSSWQTAVAVRINEARGHIAQGSIKYVVVDTLSSLCSYYDIHFLARAGKDPRLAYNASLVQFRIFLAMIRTLQCPQIWLCHSRSAYVDPVKETDQQRAQRTASTPGEPAVDLALTRGWGEVVRPITNLTMGLDVVKGTTRREFVTRETNNMWYVKNRYDDLLLPREPVDLKSIFERITAFEANLKQERKAS